MPLKDRDGKRKRRWCNWCMKPAPAGSYYCPACARFVAGYVRELRGSLVGGAFVGGGTVHDVGRIRTQLDRQGYDWRKDDGSK